MVSGDPHIVSRALASAEADSERPMKDVCRKPFFSPEPSARLITREEED